MHINLSVLTITTVYSVAYKVYTHVPVYTCMQCYLIVPAHIHVIISCVRISDEQPSCKNITKPIIKARKIYRINLLTTIMLIVSPQERPAATT